MATVERTENGWFEVKGLPNGDYWTMDLEDWDETYAESAVEAWTAWLEYIRTQERPND